LFKVLEVSGDQGEFVLDGRGGDDGVGNSKAVRLSVGIDEVGSSFADGLS
jgi:hypothetical protein